MKKLDTIRKSIRQTNKEIDQLRKKEMKSADAVMKIKTRIQQKERRTGSSLKKSDELMSRLTKESQNLAGIKKKIDEQLTLKDKLKVDIGKLKTHQNLVENLDDAFPVLLLPVRLQTRFMTIKHVTRNLSRKEIADVNELSSNDKRKVSKSLSRIDFKTTENRLNIPLPNAKFKRKRRTGLPSFIPKEQPKQGLKKVEDQQELWVRIYPDDIFVHTHEEHLTQGEYNSAKSFWQEVANADSAYKKNLEEGADPDETSKARRNLKVGAWRVLVNVYGTARAGWIVKSTKPAEVSVSDGEPVLTGDFKLPELSLKESSWSKAPRTYMMPDRFVVRLYRNGTFREVTGNTIPDELILGLDPETTAESDAFELKGEERQIPDDIKWLTDFEAAEKFGMGVRVPLSNAEAKNGFDKIVVLGMDLSQDQEASKERLEKLIENHQYKIGGMALIQQGTPTNNTSQENAGYSSSEIDPEISFDDALGQPNYAVSSSHTEKKDGQFLAEALGIQHNYIQTVHRAGQEDICEALMMNRALYPATTGYMLEQFFNNVVSRSDRIRTRRFQEDYVIGRGFVPSIRIDDQPYGIIPTTAFSKWKISGSGANDTFASNLYHNVLQKFDANWAGRIDDLKYISDPSIAPADFSKTFLEIIGLHASSVEFYQRFIGGPNLVSVMPNYMGILETLLSIQNIFTIQFNTTTAPTLLDHGYAEEVKQLTGPVVDSLKLSEKRGLAKLKGSSKNYIDYLLECTIDIIRKEDFSDIAPDQKNPPRALLYLMLRHSLLREFLNTGLDILIEGNVASEILKVDFELDQLAGENLTLRPEHEIFIRNSQIVNKLPEFMEEAKVAVKKEIPATAKVKEREKFVNEFVGKKLEVFEKDIQMEIERQSEAFKVEQNKFACLNKKFPSVTGSLTLEDHVIRLKKRNDLRTRQLNKVNRALKKLKDLPTARLERAFVEHLDTCNYRLDAWLLGSVAERLHDMREKKNEGIYLGAYGILEHIRPKGSAGIHVKVVRNPERINIRGNERNVITPIIDFSQFDKKKQFEKFLKEYFVYLGSGAAPDIVYNKATKKFMPAPVVNPAISQGFVHAPSIGQALTGAVLKGGYQAHRDTGSAEEALSVNLNSKRVRMAMHYLQGMQQGQELGALLGYQFERGLHDDPVNNLDQYILELRNAYPFNAGKVHEIGNNDRVEQAEAYNVVDGLEMLKDYQASNNNLPSKITSISGITNAARNSIEAQLKQIAEALDAVNDLMIAESVFQMVSGSPEASSAALKILNESGEINQMPEVAKVPRSGLTLSHKVGIQIPVVSNSTAWTSNKATARSKTCSSVNNWLAGQLPSPDLICSRVKITEKDQEGNIVNERTEEVSMAQLGIECIDFVMMLGSEPDNTQNGELPIRIKHHLISSGTASTSETIDILYRDGNFRAKSKMSLFAITPLVKALYKIITGSRPIVPEDIVSPSQVNPETGLNGTLMNTHLENCMDDLVNQDVADSIERIRNNIETSLANLTPIMDDDQTISSSDYRSYLDVCSALLAATVFDIKAAIPNMDLGFTKLSRQILADQCMSVIKTLDKKKEQAANLLSTLPGGSDRDNFQVLKQTAEQLFGRGMLILPEIMLDNDAEVQNALDHTDWLDGAEPDALNNWLLGLAVVRPALKNYQILKYLRDIYQTADKNKELQVAQLPFIPSAENRWMGLPIFDKESAPLDPQSLVFEYPDSHSANSKQMGFILDEWSEIIPEEQVDTGIALHYNRPNNEAPQAMLLAVPPEQTGNWSWEDLMDTINETLDLAKKRAVEPDQLRANNLLFKLLPGLVAAMNAEGNTPSLDFGRNNLNFLLGILFPVIDSKLIALNG